MGNNPGESYSLRSLSPSYSAHPAVPDADFSAIGTDFENTDTRHRHSNASRGHAYEIIGHDPIQRPKASSYNRLADDSWALEIFAWLLGAVTLAILITVLAVFNTKPLSQWNSSVSVNTLVNVLTTISSTALIFPIGSSVAQLRWLWLRKKERVLADFDNFGPGPVQVFVMVFKHPRIFLAYLGLINVILCLLFGPITQETISLPVLQRQVGPATGSVAISMAYQVANPPRRSTVLAEDEKSIDGSGSYSYPSVVRPMELSINQAFTEMTADPSDVKATCQTSNCNFEPYSTMSICSRVDDVTPDLVRHCPHNNLNGKAPGCSYIVKELQAHPPWRLGNLTTGDDGGITTYSLWIGASYVVRHDENAKLDYTFPNPNTLTEFYVIYFTDTSVFNTTSRANTTAAVVVLKGGLDLCVTQYNTTVINGTTLTVQQSQSTDLKWSTVGKTVGKTSFSATSATTGGAEYWMDENTLGAFNNFLGVEVFRGASSQGIDVINAGTGSETTESDAPATLAGLLVNQDRAKGRDGLKKMLDTLGTSMTNSLRSTSDRPITTTPGIALTPEVHISVSFTWLIVPILSVLLSLVFLLLVIFETRRQEAPVWKNSGIAALLAVDRDLAGRVGGMDHGRGVKQRGGEVRVRLRGERGGWTLGGGG